MNLQQLWINKYLLFFVVLTIIITGIFVSFPSILFKQEFSITCENGTKYIFSNKTHLIDNRLICVQEKQMYLNIQDINFNNGIK